MYTTLVFLHVLSALFLGSFLAFPFVIHTLRSSSDDKLEESLKIILNYSRYGHFALVLLTITGSWMVIAYPSYPSIFWVALAYLLLILIGGLIGIMMKTIKSIILAESLEKKRVDNMAKLKWYGWITFTLILAAAFTMINRSLFL